MEDEDEMATAKAAAAATAARNGNNRNGGDLEQQRNGWDSERRRSIDNALHRDGSPVGRVGQAGQEMGDFDESEMADAMRESTADFQEMGVGTGAAHMPPGFQDPQGLMEMGFYDDAGIDKIFAGTTTTTTAATSNTASNTTGGGNTSSSNTNLGTTTGTSNTTSTVALGAAVSTANSSEYARTTVSSSTSPQGGDVNTNSAHANGNISDSPKPKCPPVPLPITKPHLIPSIPVPCPAGSGNGSGNGANAPPEMYPQKFTGASAFGDFGKPGQGGFPPPAQPKGGHFGADPLTGASYPASEGSDEISIEYASSREFSDVEGEKPQEEGEKVENGGEKGDEKEKNDPSQVDDANGFAMFDAEGPLNQRAALGEF